MIRSFKWYPGNDPGQRIKVKDGELGKVGCCCGGECCLYPSEAVVAELIHAVDLPATIVITYGDNGPVTFTKSGATYTGTIDGVDYIYKIDLIGGSNLWQLSIVDGLPEPETAFMCLLGIFSDSFHAVDEFPDNLTMDFDNGTGVSGSVVMTRTENICVWVGEGTTDDSVPVTCRVQYDGGITPFTWYADWVSIGDNDQGQKDSPQDSPIGTYFPDSAGTLTIS